MPPRWRCTATGTHRVSLDQAIETMRQTGTDMQSKYRRPRAAAWRSTYRSADWTLARYPALQPVGLPQSEWCLGRWFWPIGCIARPTAGGFV